MNSLLYNENELRFSAQQSRIAFKASGDIDPARHVAGYFEMDFLGARRRRTRVRATAIVRVFAKPSFPIMTIYWHSHFSAGQMWSLVTQNRVGILNSTDNIPLTIDAQYVVGFNWARQPAIRFVQDVGKIAWFAVSVNLGKLVRFERRWRAGPVGTSANAGTVVPPTVWSKT